MTYFLSSGLFGLDSFFWTLRYHVDERASDFTGRFLSFCYRVLVEALAASPAACLKPSINQFVFCTHRTLFTFHQSVMFSEFQKEFFDQILLFPFWLCFHQPFISTSAAAKDFPLPLFKTHAVWTQCIVVCRC